MTPRVAISRSDIAEREATAAIQAYCEEMVVRDVDDLACLLTKLISTTAQAVVKYCGTDAALQILEQTGAHIRKQAEN